ncbi:MAG: hypothetical protein LBO80_11505 [Treponema sp.]|jgi:hypothetical protein|nr:hypothetical protein [Treponema sp.]
MKGMGLLLPVIAGFFWSCASQNAPEASPPPPPVMEYAEPLTRESSGLRPITREIVSQVSNGGNSIKNLQYYISDQLTLEIESVVQQIDINPQGEGLYQEITTQSRIIIGKETGGILKNTYRDAGGFLVLEIIFDEANDRYTLFFRENPQEQRFSLIYDEASGAVNYGGERYRASFSGEVPYLLVKFEEEQLETPEVRHLRGRTILQNNSGGGEQQ